MTTLRPLLRQIVTYLVSGGSALALALAAYTVMIEVGVWYIAASVISDGIGLLIVFLLNKYFVFEKKEKIVTHAIRYALVQVLNTVFQAAILYVLVEHADIDTITGRLVAIASCVPVNFVLYKFFVYV